LFSYLPQRSHCPFDPNTRAVPTGHRPSRPARRRVITLSNDHCQVHLDAVEHHGGDAAESRIYASQWTIVAEDPERIWAQIGEHAFYQVNTGH
jgi:hypothetical protein